eukprot:UN27288
MSNIKGSSFQITGIGIFWVILITLIFMTTQFTTKMRSNIFSGTPDNEIEGHVQNTNLQSSLFILVTARSEDYGRLKMGLRKTAKIFSKCADCLFIIYDLGLTSKQRKSLRAYSRVTLRTFMRDVS